MDSSTDGKMGTVAPETNGAPNSHGGNSKLYPLNNDSHYNLDYPEKDQLRVLQLDPQSRFYARLRPRTLDLPEMLPYHTETPREQARFLSHIVSHLYIAIKTLDLQGSIAVSQKDLHRMNQERMKAKEDEKISTKTVNEGNAPTEDLDMDSDSPDPASDWEPDEQDDSEDSESDDGLADDDDSPDSIDTDATQHKRSAQSAAHVSVSTWTHELLVWLKMKYDMPVSLRASLVRVYYAICMSRGQHLNLRVYARAFEQLLKNDNSKMLKDYGLVLPWKPLYDDMINLFLSVELSTENFERKDGKILLRIAARASQFFDPSSLPHIYEGFCSRLDLSNSVMVISNLAMAPRVFNGGVDDPLDIRHYIESFFYIWAKLSKTSRLDMQMTTRMGLIAMQALSDGVELGPHGIFTSTQITFVMKTLMNSLSINVAKYASQKAKYFHGYATLLVFLMIGDATDIMSHITTMLGAIQSYIHPSNSGEWSKPISRLIHALVHQVHKRYISENEEFGSLVGIKQEYKMSRPLIENFLGVILPLVKTGLQSKRSLVAASYVAALPLLAYLNPARVMEFFLLDIYESLEGVISTHRVSVAFQCMEALMRYFAQTPTFRVHVTRLLLISLAGIDSNDLEKSIYALDVFSAAANFIPYGEIESESHVPSILDSTLAIEFTQRHLEWLRENELRNNTDGFEASFESNFHDFDSFASLEQAALTSSSTAFRTIVKTMLERIFMLLENIPDPSKSEGIEKDFAGSLPKLLYVLFEAFSDDVFDCFCTGFFDFVFNNTYHTVADIAAEICGGLIKRDPSRFPKYSMILMDRIREDIEENGAGASRTGVDIVPRDQALFWNLVILNECVGNAGTEVHRQSRELMEFSYFLMDSVKGPAVFASTYMVNLLLQTVTKIRLTETRLLAPGTKITADCWGGYQFDKKRFENLDFSWFIPNDKDVEFAVSCFCGHVKRSLSNIKRIMGGKKDDDAMDVDNTRYSPSVADELRVNILYLGYALSGASHLFDPSFNEDIPNLHPSLRELLEGGMHEDLEGLVEEFEENEKHCIRQLTSSIDLPETDENYGRTNNELERDFGKNDFEKNDYESTDLAEVKSVESEKHSDHDLLQPLFHDHRSLFESARATPTIGNIDASSMNPSVTSRDHKLYTSKYFFSDDLSARRTNKQYLRLHKTRHLVGKALHVIGRFLTMHFMDNTKLFEHFLFAVNIWFCDVGRERVLGTSHAKIPFDYVSFVQNIPRIHKPYTRMALGSRLECYHNLRVALHATSRVQTPVENTLLKDVVKLGVSTYMAIADPAQLLLADAMKRVNGAYSVIIKAAFRHVWKALSDGHDSGVECGLAMFRVSKIKSKLRNDYFNLKQFLALLYKCFTVDKLEVQVTAYALFEGVSDVVATPSSVCLIDEAAIESISPASQEKQKLSDSVNEEGPSSVPEIISLVVAAKSHKLKAIFQQLRKIEELVLTHEKSQTYWKTTNVNLKLLSALEEEIEMPTNPDVYSILGERSGCDHPVNSRLALKGLTNLVFKLFHLQSVGYDLRKMCSFDPPPSVKVVDTRPGKEMTDGSSSYYSTWKNELVSDHPSYYLDFRATSGWLFWGELMLAVSPEVPLLNLNAVDLEAVRCFAKVVNRKWLLDIVQLWVTDNESTSAFQGTNVFLTTALVMLLLYGFLEDFTIDDLLNCITDIYIADDRSTHIVACELISGILMGTKYMLPETAAKKDDFLYDFLTNVFENDLSPDNRGVWSIFSWWTPARVDCRRFPKVMKTLMDFRVDSNGDSAVRQATRVSYLRAIVAMASWSNPYVDHLMKMCLENFTSGYEAIRTQIGSLMAILSFQYYCESIGDAQTFARLCNDKMGLQLYGVSKEKRPVDMVPELLQQVEEWRVQVEGHPPQEILNSKYIYCATTILTWFGLELNTNMGILYQKHVVEHIVPFLLRLINMKEVCQLGNIDPITTFKRVSQIPYSGVYLDDIVTMLEKYAHSELNVVQTIIVGEFTETFYFKNLLTMSATQRARVVALTVSLCYHKQVEVRENAALTLSGLIHSSSPAEVAELVPKYSKKFTADLDATRKRYKKTKQQEGNKINAEDVPLMHGATLGLGALVHAFAFESPPPSWMPQILTTLASKSSGLPGVIGKTAKDTLGKFKKNRQDTWHIDSRVFSSEQIQDLEGVLWKSYFI